MAPRKQIPQPVHEMIIQKWKQNVKQVEIASQLQLKPPVVNKIIMKYKKQEIPMFVQGLDVHAVLQQQTTDIFEVSYGHPENKLQGKLVINLMLSPKRMFHTKL